MKVKGVHHIGVAVRDLEAAVKRWAALLGGQAGPIEELPERGVRLAHLRLAQGTEIELITPLGADSPVARSLDTRGEGIHHFTVDVADIDAAVAELRSAGLRLVSDTPQRGAGGIPVAFVHPHSLNGVLLEIRQGEKRKPRKPRRALR
jgi:methylmalonyl-CoA epimerase